jgi:acyl carrier protein
MRNALAVIREFLQARLGLDPARITPEARLEALDIDSLVLLELFFEFEETLGIKLSADIPTPKTIAELLAIVERLQDSAAG